MKVIKNFSVTILFLVASIFGFLISTAHAADTQPSNGAFKEGKDYTRLSNPMPTRDSNKVEVIEFFWYGCPHCYAFEPTLEAWVAKLPPHVDFWRSPVVWGDVKKTHAQVYYTAEALGVLDKTHKAFFDAVHEAELTQKSEDVYTAPETIKAFFKNYGVSNEKFDQAFASFGVMSKVTMADARGRSYTVSGVPTLIVNGKYVVQGSMPNALAVVDYLITQEKK